MAGTETVRFEVLGCITILSALCKAHNKWGMMLSTSSDKDEFEIQKAVPFLDIKDCFDLRYGEIKFILCEEKSVLYQLYQQVKGDDGPPELNNYGGPANVYALTCDPLGNWQNENT